MSDPAPTAAADASPPPQAEGDQPRCPICGGVRFSPIKNRPREKCRICGSFARIRFLALAIQRLAPAPTGSPVVHFAPERSMAKVLHEMFGEAYTPADFDPTRYRTNPRPVSRVDLGKAAEHFAPSTVQGFVHSHVLEHVPVPFPDIFGPLNAAIEPGGFHAFVLPMNAGPYMEDFDLTMPKPRRRELFGHPGHVRNIAPATLDETVFRHFEGFDRIPLSGLMTEDDLRRSAIPPQPLDKVTGNSPIVFRKRPA